MTYIHHIAGICVALALAACSDKPNSFAKLPEQHVDVKPEHVPLGSNNPHIPSKPSYTLRIDTERCAYQMRVNDVPIITMPRGHVIVTNAPINEWVRSGENTVELIITPQPGQTEIHPEANILTGINVRQFGDFDHRTALHALHWKNGQATATKPGTYHFTKTGYERKANGLPADSADVTVLAHHADITPQKIVIRQTIKIRTEFPEWAWFNSDIITDTPETRASLMHQYRRIHSLWNIGLTTLPVPLFDERGKELEIAFSTADGFLRDRLFRSLGRMSADANSKLFPLKASNVDFHLLGNGRLAKFTHWDGDGALFFNGEYSHTYDMTFRRENGEWILTR